MSIIGKTLCIPVSADINTQREYKLMQNPTRRQQVEITITQRILVDPCIAAEIKELNDVHNIDTHFSCCGHGYGKQGYIIVKELDAGKMERLGYIRKGRRIHWYGYYLTEKTKIKAHESVQFEFKPMSECTCRKGFQKQQA